MYRVLAVLMFLLTTAPLAAVPVRRAAPQAPELPSIDPKVHDLHGEWAAYEIEQSGRAFVIEGLGNNGWTGRGWINQDGSMSIWWVSWEGQCAVGVYHMNLQGVPVGRWQWCDKAHMVGGVIFGAEPYHDSIHAKAKE